MRKVFGLPVAAALLLAMAAPAAASASTRVIVLPGASSAEGITAGKGNTFYVTDLFRGDIYRGDLRRGSAELFIDVPDGPPNITKGVGMDVDLRHDLLFVAGGDQGTATVYDSRTGATVAAYDIGAQSLINDVTVTPAGAWFTDSLQPKLYFVPIVHGRPGALRTLELSGPAAGPSGAFFQNGIASTPSGDTLLVAPTPLGKVCTINPATGESTVIEGVDVSQADGLVLDGRRLWVVQTFSNKITKWRLGGDFSRGKPAGAIEDSEFHVPLSAAKFGDRLAVVNSHLDTGYPPVSPTYEVVVVRS
jgi:sugar lactone lactonase YvrE